MLVIQIVEILWTKATRGAPRSNERVKLPRAFSTGVVSGECFVQTYRMTEWHSFAAKLLRSEAMPLIPDSIGALRISSEPRGVFSLGILGTPSDGQPRRRAINEVAKLGPGQYGRVRINARHSYYSGQHYSETIFNVACGAPVSADRFLLSEPEHDVELMANLF